MATVVDLSECTTRQSEEYTARMLNRRALNWWNTLGMKLGQEAIVRLSWNDVKALMKGEFYPSEKG